MRRETTEKSKVFTDQQDVALHDGNRENQDRHQGTIWQSVDHGEVTEIKRDGMCK